MGRGIRKIYSIFLVISLYANNEYGINVEKQRRANFIFVILIPYAHLQQ